MLLGPTGSVALLPATSAGGAGGAFPGGASLGTGIAWPLASGGSAAPRTLGSLTPSWLRLPLRLVGFLAWWGARVCAAWAARSAGSSPVLWSAVSPLLAVPMARRSLWNATVERERGMPPASTCPSVASSQLGPARSMAGWVGRRMPLPR